ncbi:ChbG/HpnK family deacetylase [Escherichia coli]
MVNADDFGLRRSELRHYRGRSGNGIVTSTTALVNGQAIDHAVQLSRDEPSLAIGMHFVLTDGQATDSYAGVNPRWCAGKWTSGSWQKKMLYRWKKLLRSLPVSICVSLSYFGRKPTHLDSHHHVHMFPQIFPSLSASR